MIKIGSPEITWHNDQAQLVADIWIDDEKAKMYFSVDKAYARYLVTERVDAFLVALLPLAMKKNHDIIFESFLSEKLLFQLKKFHIPTLAKYLGFYPVKLIGKASSEPINIKKAVGTGFSAGVDSFFTVMDNTNLAEESYNITHLTFLNVGSHGDYGGQAARDLFIERSKNAKKYADNNGWELILIDSNVSEILDMLYIESHTFRSMSAVLALQKLFSKYYYSSGFSFNDFQLNERDSASFDLLNLPMFSTDDTSLYPMDGHSNRLDKTEAIAHYPQSYNYLNVCQMSEENCGVCEKCRRTMLALYASDALENYANVFDLNFFYKNKNEYLGYLLFRQNNEDYQDILNKLKENHYKIPLFAYFYKHLFSLKNLFRNNDFAKNIYFKWFKKNK